MKTFGDLMKFLQENPEYQKQDLTFHLDDEFYKATCEITEEEDILDANHLFLLINNE